VPNSPSNLLDDTNVTVLKGVGKHLAATLAKLGIVTVSDLLFHLPMRYVDKTRITPIGDVRLHIHSVIQGRVTGNQINFGKRRSLSVTLDDGTGTISLRFFHFNAAQKTQMSPGAIVRCYAEPRRGTTGLEFYHPEYSIVDDEHQTPMEETLSPVYGLTEGISQGRLRKLTELAVAQLRTHAPQELLPEQINRQFGIASLSEALDYLHFPPPSASVELLTEGHHPCQQRLAFEELLAHYAVRQEMRMLAQTEKGPTMTADEAITATFLKSLPFSLTGAQLRVFEEIKTDMCKAVPMLRMVQGDVGSGKTLVAALAAIMAAQAGYQVAIVAPTSILAEQHFANFTQWLKPLGIGTTWLVGRLTASQKRQALADITENRAQVVIGTHALFQEGVNFHRLGLTVIDEQHRFGVDQRLRLREKNIDNERPHQLVMTATPIPRTLAMTAYAELDYSVIDELPPGRKPINTVLIKQKRRIAVIERIEKACKEGKQVYWVCPLVEESETLEVANAEATATELQEIMPDVTVGLVHGRLKPAEKDHVMAEFKTAKLRLLVATTVIEVGVDVPNANLMIIENPERLGLAQLHQLRGRVGRGSAASHCVLMYGDKLSQNARERLNVLRESNDGFVIAQKDLELRGPGELLGTRQTGDMQFRIADTQRDAHMVEQIHQIGKQLMQEENANIKNLIARWFGKNKVYAQV